jgi:hypothetical protein
LTFLSLVRIEEVTGGIDSRRASPAPGTAAKHEPAVEDILDLRMWMTLPSWLLSALAAGSERD